MRFYSALLMSFFVWAACSGCSSAPDYAGYERRFSAAANPDQLKALREDISRELSKKTDDERLLRLRANVNAALGDDVEGGKDIDKLAELFPASVDYQFQKCMNMERRDGYNGETTTRCYAAVLPLYEKKLSAEQLERAPIYIAIALLAEAPNAENLRKNYLRRVGDDPSHLADKQILEHFNRIMLLGAKISLGTLP
jgi:hypothetical protein